MAKKDEALQKIESHEKLCRIMQKQTHDKIHSIETQIQRIESILLITTGALISSMIYVIFSLITKKKIMQLSKHFTLEEMTKSMTTTRKGIDNTPGASEIKSLGDLCYEVLEPLRAHFDLPVTITSGYRSEALCEAIGSKKTSQHAKGQAVDLEINSVPNIKTAYWLQNNVDFDQLIMEFFDKDDPAGGWIHISYHEAGSNRKQVRTFDGKKYTEGLPDMEWKDGKVSN